MTQEQKQNLKIGDLVHTKGGHYCVVQTVDVDGQSTPVLTRCFRMGDSTKYQPGLPPAFNKRRKKDGVA